MSGLQSTVASHTLLLALRATHQPELITHNPQKLTDRSKSLYFRVVAFYNNSIPWEQNVSDSFENYVTVGEAAKRLNIHPESVRRLIRTGKLSARKFANTWLIERAMLEQFANHYDPRPGKKATLL